MRFLLTAFIVMIYSASTAQKIIGEVKDGMGKPLVAATALLKKSADSSVVKLSVTGSNGAYEFLNIRSGNYFVAVSSIGYSNSRSKEFLYQASTDYSVPGMSLQKTVGGLKAVEVIAQKPPIEVKEDKISALSFFTQTLCS